MNIVTEYAIRRADLKPDCIIAAIEQLDPSMVERFVQVMLGLVDPDGVKYALHKVVTIKGRTATLVEVNYIQDYVKYSYTAQRYLWFKDIKAAKDFSKEGLKSIGTEDYSTEKSVNYPILGIYKPEMTEFCTIDEWRNAEKQTI